MVADVVFPCRYGCGSGVSTCIRKSVVVSFLSHIVIVASSGTDWRADGYRWRQNGTTGIPKKKPAIKKIHFDICTITGTSKSFRKFVYSLSPEDNPEYVVVQYIGDASSASNFPHGKLSQLYVFDVGVDSFLMRMLIYNFITRCLNVGERL